MRVSHFCSVCCVPAVYVSLFVFSQSYKRRAHTMRRDRESEKKESVYGVVLSLFQFNVRLVEFYARLFFFIFMFYIFFFGCIVSLYFKNIHLHTQKWKLCGWENDYNICNSLQSLSVAIQLPTVFYVAIFKLKSFWLLSLSTMMCTDSISVGWKLG